MTAAAKSVTASARIARDAVGPTMSAGYIKALLAFAAKSGADADRLAAAAPFSDTALQQQDDRVALSSYVALLDAAAIQCRDPAFALKFGAGMQLSEITIVGLIGQSAATVGEAREQMNRYARLMVDDDDADCLEVHELVRDSQGVWLALRGRPYIAHPRLTEAAFARCVTGARMLLGPTLDARPTPFPRAIHFTHPDPGYRDEYERIFRTPITFGSDRNALLIDEAFLATPLPPSNRYVSGLLSERAETLLQDLSQSKSMRGRVESLLIPKLHTGEASLEAVAKLLGASSRTVHRRLKLEGVTFAQLLDALRHRMALHYLGDRKTSVNQTAYLVGFSDPASFSRAFKRWTGKSPSAAQHRSSGS